jgi:hypothetical protein
MLITINIVHFISIIIRSFNLFHNHCQSLNYVFRIQYSQYIVVAIKFLNNLLNCIIIGFIRFLLTIYCVSI